MSASHSETGTERHLEILVPGLFGPPPGITNWHYASLSVQGLETLLARSDRLSGPRFSDLESLLFHLFEIDVDANKDLPVAAVTRVLDLGVIDKSWWLRADPVHLRPDRDRLILADGAMLHVTQEEADQLVGEMMDVYADDGWVLKAAHPHRWYLKPPKVPDIKTSPLPAVVGRNVHAHLPQGKDSKAWHTILNEIQILLHTASVNGERERRGKLAINSLWFWGGGRLPELKHAHWSKIWSAEPISLALARLSETPHADPPTNAEEWFKLAGELPGRHLLLLDQGRGMVQYGDSESWQRFVQSLETNWMAPLLSGLKENALESVKVFTESGTAFSLTPRGARRWWRRRRPLRRYR